VHFEIHASEPQRLIDFYGAIFGWTFRDWAGGEYWVVTTGEPGPGPENLGINGGLLRRQGPSPEPGSAMSGYTCIVGVEDADATFAAALSAGAEVALALTDTPGVGRIGYLRDPDGNVFGIIQPDPEAMPG
jgi:predicted enzyme related to lactoylglutathione lyase